MNKQHLYEDHQESFSNNAALPKNPPSHSKVFLIMLRREYRRATRQLKLCMGGFGASPHSRGSACYCVDLYTGKESRYERMDVLGTIQPEDLPGWAKHGLTAIQQEQAKKKTAKERER